MLEIKDLYFQPEGERQILKDISLAIPDGKLVCLTGPNGGGKTTTISMLSTVLLPTSGEILIDGAKLDRKASTSKRKISVITQEYSMRQDMTMDEVMEYQGRLYRMPLRDIRRRAGELLDFAGLEYISSAGLRVLLAARKAMEGQGDMKLTHVSGPVMEIFEVTGFSDILTIE